MLKCTFTSPLEKHEESGITGIFLRTVEGDIGILRDHIPIVTALKAGSHVRLKKDIGELRFRIGENSFFKFDQNEGFILTGSYSLENDY